MVVMTAVDPTTKIVATPPRCPDARTAAATCAERSCASPWPFVATVMRAVCVIRTAYVSGSDDATEAERAASVRAQRRELKRAAGGNRGEAADASAKKMERETGFEPATSTLARSHS